MRRQKRSERWLRRLRCALARTAAKSTPPYTANWARSSDGSKHKPLERLENATLPQLSLREVGIGGCGDPIKTRFVFLYLLECDAELFSQLFLRNACFQAPQTNSPPDLRSARPADRVEFVDLDPGVDFLRIGGSSLNPKATARARDRYFARPLFSVPLVSEIAHEVRHRCDLQQRDVPFFLHDFVDRNGDRYHDYQLPLPIRLV